MYISRRRRLFINSYSAMFDRIYRYIAARCSDTSVVEDLTAEVMLDAFERLESYDPDKGSLEQWLVGSAKFRLIDYWRTKKPIFELKEIDESQQNTPAPNEQLDDTLSFEHHLRRLPENIKMLLRLRYIDNLSHEDIAVMTGQNPSTLRSYLSRTLKKLRLE